MSRARVAVLKVISKELSVTAAAAQYGYSRQHLHRLVARYQAGGLDAVEPRSRRPRSNPHATEDKVRDFIIKTRLELTAAGWNAGPVTIAWHLDQAGLHVPSTSTIRRILHAASLVTPEPRKRPRSSCHRFQADQPNECWQSDFTHWPLDGGGDAEIINWLNDHSRYLLACSAHAPVTGTVVVETFLQAGNAHGLPASTLTDNGRVYTARFGGGRNAFGYLLAALGITQKNGKPNHPRPGQGGEIPPDPETLAGQPAARRHPGTPAAPARRLPRALQRAPAQPGSAALHPRPGLPGTARSRARRPPAGLLPAPLRPRRRRREVSIRRAGRMHHLGIGAAHRGKEILAITDTTSVTVIELRTGEILSTHDIDPARAYWRNKQKSPGRWPGLPVT